MKNRKLIIGIVIGVVVIVIGIFIYANYRYRQSDEYALKKLGYNEKDITEILKLKEKDIQTILSLDYNEKMVDLFKSKFFILSNLNRYISYQNGNSSSSVDEVVAIVNVNADKDFYTDVMKTDLEKNYLILVNKFYGLEEGYVPDDLVEMGLQYAFNGKKIRQEVYEHFRSLVNDAKKESLTIVANSTFRDYEYQKGLYDRRESNEGKEAADNYVARPGHSEHQTGLTIDVSLLNGSLGDFENTNEFTWLKDNAHRYGFILRYPKDKENITGYNYEPWHYRYVGVDVSKEIYDLGITFDEYYAYYLNK